MTDQLSRSEGLYERGGEAIAWEIRNGAEVRHGVWKGKLPVIGDFYDGVEGLFDLIIDHSINAHCHRVLGQHLSPKPIAS